MDGYASTPPNSGGTPIGPSFPASSSTPGTYQPTFSTTMTDFIELDAKSLLKDAVSVAVQDSIRRGEFSAEPKIMAAYTTSSALYYMWARKYMLPFFVLNTDPKYADALAKTTYNSLMMLITARAFGGRITLTNSIITSVGAESVRMLGEVLIEPDIGQRAKKKSSLGYQ